MAYQPVNTASLEHAARAGGVSRDGNGRIIKELIEVVAELSAGLAEAHERLDKYDNMIKSAGI